MPAVAFVSDQSAASVDAALVETRQAGSQPGSCNTTTIPPRTRREVLARDQHCCQAPGCGRTHFLEVHHITPRQLGGTNGPENLTTLCGACHRLWHERGGRVSSLTSPGCSPVAPGRRC